MARNGGQRFNARPWGRLGRRGAVGGARPALPPAVNQRLTTTDQWHTADQWLSTADDGRAHATLSDVIGAFKSAVSKRINVLRGTPGTTVWQRGFNDHIVRDTHELDLIRQYIKDNPKR